MKCPKCGYENREDVLYCNLCGLLFKKEIHKEKPSELTLPKRDFYLKNRNILFLLGVGFCNGAFLYFLTTKCWLLNFILVYVFLTFFTHEMGHTVMGIIFGYFTLPAFTDYGGVAIKFSYNIWFPILIVVILTSLITIMTILTKEKKIFLIGIIIVSLYGLFAFTYLKELAISAAGHLSTAFIAGLFLTKGVFRSGKIEGCLWTGLGWFLVFSELACFIKLKINEEFRQGYITGTLFDGDVIGDLAKIAQGLNIDFFQIVNFFILIAITLPFLILVIAKFLISRRII